jgi:hypothetical protein
MRRLWWIAAWLLGHPAGAARAAKCNNTGCRHEGLPSLNPRHWHVCRNGAVPACPVCGGGVMVEKGFERQRSVPEGSMGVWGDLG